MKRLWLTLTVPTGALLVGGYGETPLGLHGHHARDAEGRPLVTSTTLRGALRDTFERLLRATGEPACARGDGRPYVDGEHIPVKALAEGCRCRACTLFGTQRPSTRAGERRFSDLRIGDATCVSPDGGRSWAVRPGVGVTRRARSAESGRLFMREAPNLPNLELRAPVDLLDEARLPELEALVEATRWLGGGRSQGAGQVEMRLSAREEAPAALDAAPGLGEGSPTRARVRLTLRSPASLGHPLLSRYLLGTRTSIPGAALRGAVGWRLASLLSHPDQDTTFQGLVAEGGAQFGPLYPVSRCGGASEGDSAPLPLTTQGCKTHPWEHPISDTLLEKLLEDAPVAVAHAGPHECPTCRAPLRRLAGYRSGEVNVATRVVTRVAIDRARASAQDHALFSQQLLQEGQVFEGELRNVPPGGWALLQRALSEEGFIGRGQSHGWGRFTAELLPPLEVAALEKRRGAFIAALLARAGAGEALRPWAERLVVMTLRTPAVGKGRSPDTMEPFLDQVRQRLGGAEVLRKMRRFVRDGAWDQRTGRMDAFWSIQAGAVYVFALPEGADLAGILAALRDIEDQGIGERRHQGFGAVRFFDPIHLNPTSARRDEGKPDAKGNQNSEGNMNGQISSKLRRELVSKAEAVSINLAQTPERGEGLKPTQLNHLVNIAQEARCAEEIELYIKYQAGRGGNTGWSMDNAKDTLAAAKEALGSDKPSREVSESEQERRRLEAWRLFAVYLARAFRYHKAAKTRVGGYNRLDPRPTGDGGAR